MQPLYSYPHPPFNQVLSTPRISFNIQNSQKFHVNQNKVNNNITEIISDKDLAIRKLMQQNQNLKKQLNKYKNTQFFKHSLNYNNQNGISSDQHSPISQLKSNNFINLNQVQNFSQMNTKRNNIANGGNFTYTEFINKSIEDENKNHKRTYRNSLQIPQQTNGNSNFQDQNNNEMDIKFKDKLLKLKNKKVNQNPKRYSVQKPIQYIQNQRIFQDISNPVLNYFPQQNNFINGMIPYNVQIPIKNQIQLKNNHKRQFSQFLPQTMPNYQRNQNLNVQSAIKITVQPYKQVVLTQNEKNQQNYQNQIQKKTFVKEAEKIMIVPVKNQKIQTPKKTIQKKQIQVENKKSIQVSRKVQRNQTKKEKQNGEKQIKKSNLMKQFRVFLPRSQQKRQKSLNMINKSIQMKNNIKNGQKNKQQILLKQKQKQKIKKPIQQKKQSIKSQQNQLQQNQKKNLKNLKGNIYLADQQQNNKTKRKYITKQYNVQGVQSQVKYIKKDKNIKNQQYRLTNTNNNPLNKNLTNMCSEQPQNEQSSKMSIELDIIRQKLKNQVNENHTKTNLKQNNVNYKQGQKKIVKKALYNNVYCNDD